MKSNIKSILNSLITTARNSNQRIVMPEKKEKMNNKVLVVNVVEQAMSLIKSNGYDTSWHGGKHYFYNGKYWEQLSKENIKKFLSSLAMAYGVPKGIASYYEFPDDLHKQFQSVSRDMSTPSSDAIKINSQNGTLTFGKDGVHMVPFNKQDCMTYALGYDYNPEGTAPEFMRVLDDALPVEGQRLLQEYIASIFLPNFNHQKALLLYGKGGEGKSLIISIISAALGRENIVERSIESLCALESRTVADLEGKLLNICSEMNSKFNLASFKQLVSKDPITARRLYGEPYTIYSYASLLFSCNELPKNIEHTNAYFRRLLILPFLNSIPEEKQDRSLGERIIKNELPGVLNWIVGGVKRLLEQGHLSKCEFAEEALTNYRTQSNSVALFLEEGNYEKTTDVQESISLKELFNMYKEFCSEANYHPCGKITFSNRLENAGYTVKRVAQGMTVLIKQMPVVIEKEMDIADLAFIE